MTSTLILSLLAGGGFVTVALWSGVRTASFESRLELPLIDIVDFLESPDGSILVHSGLFSRVQHYSANGDFIRAWGPMYRRGVSHWASTKRELLVCTSGGVIVFSPRGQQSASLTAPEGKVVAWLYDSDERIVPAPEEQTIHIPKPRMLHPGDIACDPRNFSWRRLEYFTRDGGVVRAAAHGLARYSRQGTLMARVGTPWYVWLWLLSWLPAVAILLTLVIRWTKRYSQGHTTPVVRRD